MSPDKGVLDAPTIPATIEQTYALRVRLTALLAQTVQAEAKIKYRIADLESEAGRLKTHLEQTTSGVETLKRSIHTVDEAIGRRVRELRASVELRAQAESATGGENHESGTGGAPRESRRRPR